MRLVRLHEAPFTDRLVAKFGLPVEGWRGRRASAARRGEGRCLRSCGSPGSGVIESATLELGPGLTVITGETGAGKTMVVTALGLLLGGRADSGAVRVGQQARPRRGLAAGRPTCRDVAAAVEAAGGEVEDDQRAARPQRLGRGPLAGVRRRRVGAGLPARRRGRAAGRRARPVRPAPAAPAARAARRPRRASAARRPRALLARLPHACYAELRETERELAEVVASARERAREADLLRFGLGEIEAVAPQPGEDAVAGRGGAAARARRHAAHRRRVGARGAVLRRGQPRRAGRGRRGRATPARRRARARPEAAGELADRVAEITYLLSDVAADVASYADGLETDPARLAAVSERRAALTALTRKYGETADEVLAWAEASAARLAELDDTDDRITRLARAARRPARAARPRPPPRCPRPARPRPPRLVGRADRRARPAGDAARRARRRGARRRADRRRAARSAARRLRFGSVRGRRGRVPARRQHRAPSRGRWARAPRAASCRG